MRVLKTVGPDGGQQALSVAVACLRDGGVIAAPTETVYGLMTRWDDDAGRERIYDLKRRPRDRLLQMLAPSLKHATRYGLVPDGRLRILAAEFWPGPLTIVCPARGSATIGLRIPEHPFIRGLLNELDVPLAATSANLSGQRAARTAVEAVSGLEGEPDVLVDGGEVHGDASTVVSLAAQPYTVLREGPVTAAMLQRALMQRPSEDDANTAAR